MCWFFVARRSHELHIPGDSKIRTFSMALITAYDITEIADSEVDNAGLGVFLLRNTVGGHPIDGHHRQHGPAVGKL